MFVNKTVHSSLVSTNALKFVLFVGQIDMYVTKSLIRGYDTFQSYLGCSVIIFQGTQQRICIGTKSYVLKNWGFYIILLMERFGSTLTRLILILRLILEMFAWV